MAKIVQMKIAKFSFFWIRHLWVFSGVLLVSGHFWSIYVWIYAGLPTFLKICLDLFPTPKFFQTPKSSLLEHLNHNWCMLQQRTGTQRYLKYIGRYSKYYKCVNYSSSSSKCEVCPCLLQNDRIASASLNLFLLDNISTKITASF